VRNAFLTLLQRAITVLASPAFIAVVLLCCGYGMAVAGVYVLAGLGVTLVVGSIPFLYLGGIMLRGALHGT
jgi:hypothetical protein